jgi:hypothetical protein
MACLSPLVILNWDRILFLKNVAGKFTLHTDTNEIRKMISKLAMANNYIIKSMCFKHKRTYKGTWKIPGSDQ